MYTLYQDKTNKFSCKVEIEGASPATAKARLILEGMGFPAALLFPGTISLDGEEVMCSVTIPNSKTLLPEGLSGSLKLELIVEDTIFFPWESPFTVEVSKKAVVTEAQAQITEAPKPKVKVSIAKMEKKAEQKLEEETFEKTASVIEEKTIPPIFFNIVNNIKKEAQEASATNAQPSNHFLSHLFN